LRNCVRPARMCSAPRSHAVRARSSREIREAVPNRGGGVRSRGERLPRRGVPEPQQMMRDAVLGFLIHDKTDLATRTRRLLGFWIIEAADLDVALKLAAEGSKACNRKIEVRPFL
jgi:hypothetical protein